MPFVSRVGGRCTKLVTTSAAHSITTNVLEQVPGKILSQDQASFHVLKHLEPTKDEGTSTSSHM